MYVLVFEDLNLCNAIQSTLKLEAWRVAFNFLVSLDTPDPGRSRHLLSDESCPPYLRVGFPRSLQPCSVKRGMTGICAPRQSAVLLPHVLGKKSSHTIILAHFLQVPLAPNSQVWFVDPVLSTAHSGAISDSPLCSTWSYSCAKTHWQISFSFIIIAGQGFHPTSFVKLEVACQAASNTCCYQCVMSSLRQRLLS